MNKEFQTLRKKQRFGLRKLNIGVTSVLLGFTIFGYNLASQAPVAHAATSTVATSAGSGASGSSATGVVSRSQDSNSQAASATSSAATDSQAAPETQVTVPAASQSSAPANSGNATSSPASQAGTVSANHTAIGKTPSSKTVSVDEATSPAVQSRILMMNLAVVNPKTEDTTLPKSTQTCTLVTQPLLEDYYTHLQKLNPKRDLVSQQSLTYYLTHLHDGNRDGHTWVNNTLKFYPDATMDTIFGTLPKRGSLALFQSQSRGSLLETQINTSLRLMSITVAHTTGSSCWPGVKIQLMIICTATPSTLTRRIRHRRL
ncbi:YSIRK-type signal peptide-containing protein [Limosilactobacillus reuteri]|nr:YSIRK-type signal peptide-containing protein [Limosilactobacillus reuteri]